MTNIRTFVYRYSAFLLAALVLTFGATVAFAHADSSKGVGVFIGANGNAYVHGATVTATSTSGVTATTNLAGNAITWNVLASSTTRFGKLGQGFAALAHVAIGDIVSFFGKVSGSGSALTVEAQVLKDRTKSATSTPPHLKKDKEGKWHDKGFHGSFKGFFKHGFWR